MSNIQPLPSKTKKMERRASISSKDNSISLSGQRTSQNFMAREMRNKSITPAPQEQAVELKQRSGSVEVTGEKQTVEEPAISQVQEMEIEKRETSPRKQQQQSPRKQQKSPLKKKKKEVAPPSPVKPPKIIFHCANTVYDVIKEIAKHEMGWRITTKDHLDWDIWWTDVAPPTEKFQKLKTWNKINHFPGMMQIAKKNYLARNLNKMKKQFPDEYKFYPKTWLFPYDIKELLAFQNKKRAQKPVFIVKPEYLSQGKGIFLTKKIETIDQKEHLVVQEYLKNPLLIDEYKFDLRIYVLVTNVNPLRIFIHHQGLTRFASEKFKLKAYNNPFIHLTNYAINKDNQNFQASEDPDAQQGHKRSLKSVFDTFQELGLDIEGINKQIKDIIVKTLISIQPDLLHSYRTCQPGDIYNNMCFEILGFDIMLDTTGKCYLIEVNHAPSFNIDTKLDEVVKRDLLVDTFRLLNCTIQEKNRVLEALKQIQDQRMMHQSKRHNTVNKQALYAQNLRDRDQNDLENLGGYERIFPSPDFELNEKYNMMLGQAKNYMMDMKVSKQATVNAVTPVETKIMPPPLLQDKKEKTIINKSQIKPPSEQTQKADIRSPLNLANQTSEDFLSQIRLDKKENNSVYNSVDLGSSIDNKQQLTGSNHQRNRYHKIQMTTTQLMQSNQRTLDQALSASGAGSEKPSQDALTKKSHNSLSQSSIGKTNFNFNLPQSKKQSQMAELLSHTSSMTEEQKKLHMLSKLEQLKIQQQQSEQKSERSICMQNPQTPADSNPQGDSESNQQLANNPHQQTASFFQNQSIQDNRRPPLLDQNRLHQNESQFSMQMKQFQSQTPLLPTLPPSDAKTSNQYLKKQGTQEQIIHQDLQKRVEKQFDNHSKQHQQRMSNNKISQLSTVEPRNSNAFINQLIEEQTNTSPNFLPQVSAQPNSFNIKKVKNSTTTTSSIQQQNPLHQLQQRSQHEQNAIQKAKNIFSNNLNHQQQTNDIKHLQQQQNRFKREFENRYSDIDQSSILNTQQQPDQYSKLNIQQKLSTSSQNNGSSVVTFQKYFSPQKKQSPLGSKAQTTGLNHHHGFSQSTKPVIHQNVSSTSYMNSQYLEKKKQSLSIIGNSNNQQQQYRQQHQSIDNTYYQAGSPMSNHGFPMKSPLKIQAATGYPPQFTRTANLEVTGVSQQFVQKSTDQTQEQKSPQKSGRTGYFVRQKQVYKLQK